MPTVPAKSETLSAQFTIQELTAEEKIHVFWSFSV